MDFATSNQATGSTFGNEFDAQDPRSKRLTAATRPGAGGRIIGTTASGGFVRTRSYAEIAADNAKKASSGINKKRNRRNASRPPTIDIRKVQTRNGLSQGQIIATLINRTTRDTDDQTSTLSEWLKKKIESNDQDFLRSLDQGVLKLPQGGVIGLRNANQVYRTDTRTRAVGGGFGGGGGGGGGGNAGISSSGGTIGLPTPDNLVENMRLNYTSRAQPVFAAIQNALQRGVRAAATGIVAPNSQDAKEQIDAVVAEAVGVFDSIQNEGLNHILVQSLDRLLLKPLGF